MEADGRKPACRPLRFAAAAPRHPSVRRLKGVCCRKCGLPNAVDLAGAYKVGRATNQGK